jgi:hypothetical protein
MKVRIQGNSFRFRLKQPEVQILKEEGRIQETVEFGQSPASRLSFSLQVTHDVVFSVLFQSDTVTFYVPSQIAERWITSDGVGFEELVDTGDNRKIKLLVEKDFRCMQACADENAGAFEQPFH